MIERSILKLMRYLFISERSAVRLKNAVVESDHSAHIDNLTLCIEALEEELEGNNDESNRD